VTYDPSWGSKVMPYLVYSLLGMPSTTIELVPESSVPTVEERSKEDR